MIVAFIRGCCGFYASLFTRYVEDPDAPAAYYPDGERAF